MVKKRQNFFAHSDKPEFLRKTDCLAQENTEKDFSIPQESCKIYEVCAQLCIRCHKLSRGGEMAGYILLGSLAAFGFLSALWALFGWLLPGGRHGVLISFDDGKRSFVRRYLWLRRVGLLSCPLILVEPEGLDAGYLTAQGIEICTWEEISFRLGIGAKDFDAGIGDHSGRHQRGGVSEL